MSFSDRVTFAYHYLSPLRKIFQKNPNAFTVISQKFRMWQTKPRKKRTPFFAPCRLRPQGSLTVEFALAFTLVLFPLCGLLSFFQIISVQNRIQQALQHAVQEVSAYQYVGEVIPGLFVEEAELSKQEKEEGTDASTRERILSFVGEKAKAFVKNGFQTAYIAQAVQQELGKDWLDNSLIVGGSKGLSFVSSLLVLDWDYVDARVSYKVKIMFLPEGINEITLMQRCRRRLWTGFEPEPETEESAGEDMVYVTAYGTKYHTYRDCAHLKRSIRTVSKDQVDNLRNESGQKYGLCSFCARSGVNAYGYITNQGDCFHNRQDCGALTRYIQEISRENIGERGLCSSCKKRKEVERASK